MSEGKVRKIAMPTEFAAAPVAGAGDLPPQAAVPGIKGRLPLPVGKPLMNPRSLLPEERLALTQIGWKEGDPLPTNLADRLSQMQQAAAGVAKDLAPELDPRNLAPPVPMSTPALDVENVDIKSLPPQHQAELQQLLAEAKAIASNQAAQSAEPPVMQDMKQIDLTDEPADSPTAEAPKPAGGETGAASSLAPAYCVHCGWDQAQRDIPEPDNNDRLWYLQAVLGQRLFEKQYTLLGGQLTVVFQECSTQQLDNIYKALGVEAKANDWTAAEFGETAERHHVATQLRSIRFGDGETIDFPNSHKDPPVNLPALFAVMQAEAFKSGTVYRTVHTALRQFQRLISKLEACAERENFWPAA